LPRLVIFDYDGVLADTAEAVLALSRSISAQLSHPRHPTRADLAALEPMSFAELARQMELPQRLQPGFTAALLEALTERDPPAPLVAGMGELIRDLHEAGVHQAVVSGSPQRLLDRFLRHHDLQRTMARVYGLDAPGSKAQKILRAAGALDVLPAECCMVGDASSDMRAAQEAGVLAVGVTWGNQDRPRLLAAGADQVADRPQALRALLLR